MFKDHVSSPHFNNRQKIDTFIRLGTHSRHSCDNCTAESIWNWNFCFVVLYFCRNAEKLFLQIGSVDVPTLLTNEWSCARSRSHAFSSPLVRIFHFGMSLFVMSTHSLCRIYSMSMHLRSKIKQTPEMFVACFDLFLYNCVFSCFFLFVSHSILFYFFSVINSVWNAILCSSMPYG